MYVLNVCPSVCPFDLCVLNFCPPCLSSMCVLNVRPQCESSMCVLNVCHQCASSMSVINVRPQSAFTLFLHNVCPQCVSWCVSMCVFKVRPRCASSICVLISASILISPSIKKYVHRSASFIAKVNVDVSCQLMSHESYELREAYVYICI